ncbi:MAG: allantoate amidohydrolase [Hyphomicrobiales bacterium]|nr:MAG: allantoate amidohydrolase [Hyphomicrobiales bacterium]
MKGKGRNANSMGKRVMDRLDELAQISESPGMLTRRFLTPAHARAMDQVGAWMREAGLQVRVDPIANVIGRLEGRRPGAPAILIGSHIDTVIDAGKYDGNLGVVAGIEAAAALASVPDKLEHAVEVIAFGDEEGVRFPSHLLSSRSLTGAVRARDLDVVDADGISVKAALGGLGLPDGLAACKRADKDIAAYIEVHIEQGPVLQAKRAALAAVTAINGAARMRVRVEGIAGHAGTVPMALRQDALAAAAEMVVAVEEIGREGGDKLVATVGRTDVRPNAVNVVPGEVHFTIDVRSPSDAIRMAAQKKIATALHKIGKKRQVRVTAETYYEMPATKMDDRIVAAVSAGIAAVGQKPIMLASGAGHDAMAIAPKWPAAMMFVRCTDGISHNPAEHITRDDSDLAVRALIAAIRHLDATL